VCFEPVSPIKRRPHVVRVRIATESASNMAASEKDGIPVSRPGVAVSGDSAAVGELEICLDILTGKTGLVWSRPAVAMACPMTLCESVQQEELSYCIRLCYAVLVAELQ
jgi:hypothetical protein